MRQQPRARSAGLVRAAHGIDHGAPSSIAQVGGPGGALSRMTTFESDVAFLRAHGALEILEARPGEGRGRVAVSPAYQGRVMTSAVSPEGQSIGWVHRAFIEERRTGTAFDNYGGEDRFWLGPEGGQFGLFFPQAGGYVLDAWRTPSGFQEGGWEVAEKAAARIVLRRNMTVRNRRGAAFHVEVERTIALLDAADVSRALGVAIADMNWVGYASTNRITNAGTEAWTQATGLPSVWTLGQYNAAPDAWVIVPFDTAGGGEIVNARYFGEVPADRLVVDPSGVLFFKADGQHRSKIGLGPARARNVLGSYSAAAGLLTVVTYDAPDGAPAGYVNSMWEEQEQPYAGDVINSYNDSPGNNPGFYELETSSPAAALAPGASLVHVQRTFHFEGPGLEQVAQAALHVRLSSLKS